MARTIRRLKALTVARTTRPGLYPDGGGLYLQVTGASAKSWLFRYRFGGRERQAGLGSCKTYGLEEARAKALECRKLLDKGLDPISVRSAERARARVSAATSMTFNQCAAAYVAANEVAWRNAKHRAQWTSSLDTYARPVFGSLPVASIDTGLVMKAIEPIWKTKPETASRLRGRIEAVLSWAKARGYREEDNPARWRGHLDQLLPPRSKVRKVKHHTALAYAQVPAFMARLRDEAGMAALALRFAILTAARTGEVIGATWDEIDLGAGVWTVPAGRMKGGREHRVPLTDAAIELLRATAGTGYLFHGGRVGAPLSNMAMLSLLRRMNSAATTHGFRSSFRDWVGDKTNFPGELAELALAHKVGDATEQAYRRGDGFEKRRRMMDAWARFCIGPQVGVSVVPLRSAG